MSLIEIPQEDIQAIAEQLSDVVVKNIAIQAADEQKRLVQQVFDSLRSQISLEEIREMGVNLLDHEELRKEMSSQQAFLTMDLYRIQAKNWADILEETQERLNEVLSLRKVEIASETEKLRVIREVELAEVEKVKVIAEQDWDIALLRFHKIKGHLIVAGAILILGVLVGQFIEGFSRENNPRPQQHHKLTPKHHKTRPNTS